MIFFLENGKLMESNSLPADSLDSHPCFCFLSKEELISSNRYLQINERILGECLIGQASKFESHEGFDYISLNIPNSENPVEIKNHICIYFKQNLLAFCCDNPKDNFVLKEMYPQIDIEIKECRTLTLERILQIFFDKLTYEDSLILEGIQEEITNIEEALITSKKRNYITEIIMLRKKLLAYKRYYDQLSSISAAIEENENDLLTKKELRYFRILTNRTERLLSGISNLQDYVSQVREAYQTQVDINQNSIMKLFTVITAIFLPLTLIVGWYGMNLQMPEYNWSFGYPIVIIICIAVALFSILYFKKNKWF